MGEPVHIKEILPSVLIKAAKKQAERNGIPKNNLAEITENVGKEMPQDKNNSRRL